MNSPQSTYAALLKSHDELRAAIILAGKELRRNRVRNEPLLRILRRVLREARAARKEAERMRGFPV
jgi:hypothetical protein